MFFSKWLQCIYVLVHAQAFYGMVLRDIGKKSAHGEGSGTVWLEEAAESVAGMAGSRLGQKRGERGWKDWRGAKTGAQARELNLEKPVTVNIGLQQPDKHLEEKQSSKRLD